MFNKGMAESKLRELVAKPFCIICIVCKIAFYIRNCKIMTIKYVKTRPASALKEIGNFIKRQKKSKFKGR